MGGVLFSTALVTSGEKSITLEVSERGYLDWITGAAYGIPNVLVIGLIVLAVAHVLQAHTRFGRYSAAIGAGEPAAYASGVKVNRQKVIAYVLSAGFAALAGVILAGRLASGSPTLAAEMLLPSIAAVVVGGTAITGGVGSIWRTLVGALIISVVRIGMTFLGVNIFLRRTSSSVSCSSPQWRSPSTDPKSRSSNRPGWLGRVCPRTCRDSHLIGRRFKPKLRPAIGVGILPSRNHLCRSKRPSLQPRPRRFLFGETLRPTRRRAPGASAGRSRVSSS